MNCRYFLDKNGSEGAKNKQEENTEIKRGSFADKIVGEMVGLDVEGLDADECISLIANAYVRESKRFAKGLYDGMQNYAAQLVDESIKLPKFCDIVTTISGEWRNYNNYNKGLVKSAAACLIAGRKI